MGARVVIDGVDQLGTAAALRLLDQARILANAWPDTLVTMTSRPSPGFSPPEAIEMALLDQYEADSLISRLLGRTLRRHSFPISRIASSSAA
jgi:hypothetical protein